jgi:murein DD-endopeptidase MepM/ murein hydrolase activator NlpD
MSGPFRRRLLIGACALALSCSITAAGGGRPVAAQTAQASPHVPPVDAPMRDPYRPPATPYGPGNRGIEYATEPGTPVRASADGVVAFAGLIGADRYVSIDHPDGVRTSYSYLETIAVRAGEELRQGDVVGTAGDRLHFGARRNGEYFDPASLFDAVNTSRRARLVPIHDRPWT